jgi:uncharacterized protein (TIGR03000 family)
MFGKVFTLGGTLLTAAALVFATPGSSQARGGGHGGGGHGGGFHGGGFHSGGFGGYHGGYGYGSYYGGYHRGGYGYRPYYGGYYGYYPYYDAYPYNDTYPSYGSYPYDSDLLSVPAYASGGSSLYYQSAPSSSYGTILGGSILSSDLPASTSPSPAQADTAAHVTVNVPAGARLWFDDTPTTSTGSVREFASPPLTPGARYTDDIKATWNENGREVTQTRKVDVTAGGHINVNFPVAPTSVRQASAATRP